MENQRYARSAAETVERSITHADEPNLSNERDPTEGDLFEGDIMLENGLSGKNGIISARQMWTGGIIPYTISGDYSSSERTRIAGAMDVYHSKTCIKFVPKSSQHSNWISLEKGSGCSSYVGMSSRGEQQVSLGRGCVFTGIIQHELMHAAGFWHEQSRYDRDQYVTIHFDNIQSSYQNNFKTVSSDKSQTFGQSYDYGSVMHYGSTAFATNRNKPTITPKQSGAKIGQRNGLSQVDIAKLNAMYKCGTTPTTGPTTRPSTGGPITTTGPKECKDLHNSCAGWAKRSECDKNAKWMKKYCPLSCGSCESDNESPNESPEALEGRYTTKMTPKFEKMIIIENCQDKRDECKKWTASGFCDDKSLASFMSTSCPKSCKVCSGKLQLMARIAEAWK
ncbi:Zinc metalloproteinase nas-15 [Nymphon striatum]|nr:Zinc metalloproteinase nas-15 [Nymphon striatum]